jgi:hypothetical protein
MGRTAPNYHERQEFWKPPVSQHSEPQAGAAGETCERCGTDFVLGSRYCHVCGADRQNAGASPAGGAWRAWFDFDSLRDFLGQSYASLAAMIGGLVCLVAAAVTGFLFTATTLLDWQAVQLWRIEWLLAAIALFAAGILLRK